MHKHLTVNVFFLIVHRPDAADAAGVAVGGGRDEGEPFPPPLEESLELPAPPS